MGASAEQPRRFSLCALLNHVSVDSRAPEVLEVFRELKAVDFTPYTAFENHRTAAVHTSHPDVRAAIYWGERGAMVLLANLSEAPRGFTWHLSQEAIGWTGDRPRVMGRSPRRLKGLEFRYVRLTRTA
jgi:hypothetical protein